MKAGPGSPHLKDGMCVSKDLKEARCQADTWKRAFLEGLRDSKDASVADTLDGKAADESRTMREVCMGTRGGRCQGPVGHCKEISIYSDRSSQVHPDILLSSSL